MAKQLLRNARILVNGVDLSDHADSVSVGDTAEEVDVTSFSANGYREFLQGLKDGTITVSFFQDYAAGKVDATLRPLYASGATFPVVVRPNAGAAVSATNPEVTQTCVLNSYGLVEGGVGEALKTEATFRNASSAGPTVATS